MVRQGRNAGEVSRRLHLAPGRVERVINSESERCRFGTGCSGSLSWGFVGRRVCLGIVGFLESQSEWPHWQRLLVCPTLVTSSMIFLIFPAVEQGRKGGFRRCQALLTGGRVSEVHLTDVFQVLGMRCLSSTQGDHWASRGSIAFTVLNHNQGRYRSLYHPGRKTCRHGVPHFGRLAQTGFLVATWKERPNR